MAEQIVGIACICESSNRDRWRAAFESSGAGHAGIEVLFPALGSSGPVSEKWLVYVDSFPCGLDSFLCDISRGGSIVVAGLLRSAPPDFLTAGLPFIGPGRIRTLPGFIAGRWFRAIGTTAARGRIGRLLSFDLDFGPADSGLSQDPDSPAARAVLTACGLTGKPILFKADSSGTPDSRTDAILINGVIDGIEVPVSFRIHQDPAPLQVKINGTAGSILVDLADSVVNVVLDSESGLEKLFSGRLDPLCDAASAMVAAISRNQASFFGLTTVNAALESLTALHAASAGPDASRSPVFFSANDFTTANAASDARSPLRELKVFVSDACNLDCPFCFSRTPARAAPTAESFGPVFRAAVASGYDSTLLSGGEPTLNPELIDIVKSARDAGMRYVGIETNAILLDDPGLASRLVAAGLDRALVSFHSLDSDTLLRLTGSRSSLPRTIGGMQALLEAGVIVNVNCVTTELNYRELPQIAAFLTTLRPRINQIVFSFMAGLGSAVNHPELYPRVLDAAPFLRSAIDIAASVGIDAVIPGQCGLPQCVIPDRLDRFCNQQLAAASPDWLAPSIEGKIFSESCRKCAVRRWCYGVWSVYARKYGLDEFAPVQAATWTDASDNVP